MKWKQRWQNPKAPSHIGNSKVCRVKFESLTAVSGSYFFFSCSVLYSYFSLECVQKLLYKMCLSAHLTENVSTLNRNFRGHVHLLSANKGECPVSPRWLLVLHINVNEVSAPLWDLVKNIQKRQPIISTQRCWLDNSHLNIHREEEAPVHGGPFEYCRGVRRCVYLRGDITFTCVSSIDPASLLSLVGH